MTPSQLLLTIERQTGSEPLAFTVRRLVCAGFTSRDPAEIDRHVKELAGLGIAPPSTVPTFFHVASYLATLASTVEVQGPFTSGEAEFALLFDEGGPWVTVGSDHTDRFFARHSILAGKQLCPKVLATTVWPLSEVEPHWHELSLRSWVRSGRRRQLYQEATLASLLSPGELLPGLRRRAGRDLAGVVLFSGTVPTAEGQVVYGDGYELELSDPRLGRVIRLAYAVQVLEPQKR